MAPRTRKAPAWSDPQTQVWVGLLETHKRLTRELSAELEREHGLGLSAFELLGRLSGSEKGVLGLTELAERTGLSLSRVSRIVDNLEERGLVRRVACENDARAKNAHLTRKGRTLLAAARETHLAGVQERFFDHIEPDELEAMGAAFKRLSPEAGTEGGC